VRDATYAGSGTPRFILVRDGRVLANAFGASKLGAAAQTGDPQAGSSRASAGSGDLAEHSAKFTSGMSVDGG